LLATGKHSKAIFAVPSAPAHPLDTEHRQWFAPTSEVRPFSDRSCLAVVVGEPLATFDGDKVEAYPLGSVIVPGNTPQFHWANFGEYVTQVTAIGPFGLEYLNPRDDPREQNRALAG
jgi:hypothetical protein